jgi:hypothetical protein
MKNIFEVITLLILTMGFSFPAWSRHGGVIVDTSEIRFEDLQFVHDTDNVIVTTTAGKKILLTNEAHEFKSALKNPSIEAIDTLKHALNVILTTTEHNPAALANTEQLKDLVRLIALSRHELEENIDWTRTEKLATYLLQEMHAGSAAVSYMD